MFSYEQAKYKLVFYLKKDFIEQHYFPFVHTHEIKITLWNTEYDEQIILFCYKKYQSRIQDQIS